MRSHALQWERSAKLKINIIGKRYELRSVDGDVFSIGTDLSGKCDTISRLYFRDTFANCFNNACTFPTRNKRYGNRQTRHTHAHVNIDEIETSRLETYECFASLWLRLRYLLILQNTGITKLR